MPEARDIYGGRSRRTRRFRWPATLAVTVLLCSLISAQGNALGEERLPAGSTETPALDRVTGPLVETAVVGLYLQGERHRERLRVPDLDVVFLEGGRYLLPLLRTLRFLDIETQDTGTVLVFHPEGAPRAEVDYVSGTVTVGSVVRTADLMVGVSDLTRKAEVYIPAEVLAEVLGMDIRWEEQAYEFVFYTDQRLRIFEQFYRPGPALLRTGQYTLPVELPGNLPPAEVARLSGPDLNFAEVHMQTRLAASRRYQTGSQGLAAPGLRLWGQVLRGNLTTSVRQRQFGTQRGFTVDHVSWTSWFDRTEFAAGDGFFGVSELAFPSVDLLGVRINGLWGSTSEDPSLLPQSGRRQTFQPSHVFEGYAPAGSEVTLFVNGQEVDSQLAESMDSAPPGMALYRFEGLNLLTRRLNDVLIVTRAPDGTVEETTREVMRTDLLVPQGQFSYLGGSGTGRVMVGDHRTSEGLFAGGRLFYGLTPSLSIGVAGAMQDGIISNRIQRYTVQGQDLGWLPSRSTHMSSRLIWQPTGRLLISGEAARSQDPEGAASGWACKMNGEYLQRTVSFRPQVFWYSPTFFEGRNVGLRDRAGADLDVSFTLRGGSQLTLSGSHLSDNVNRDRDETHNLSLAGLQLTARDWIPLSTLALGCDQVWSGGETPVRTYSLGFDSALIPGWALRTHYLLGDDIRFSSSEDVLGARQFGFYRDIGAGVSRVELARRLGTTWRVAMSHRSSSNLSRSFLDFGRGRILGRSLQLRCFLGYDWHSDYPFADGRVEYTLDSSERNRLLLDTRYSRGEWSFNLRLDIRGLLGFVGHRPFLVRDARLSPEAGGVKGRVFLDVNANGRPDKGEPGLEQIEIVTDAGQELASGRNGQYIISGSGRSSRLRVALEPETLPAIYTPTQAVQDAILLPGIYAEVNLGVAAFGSISGRLAVPTDRGVDDGVWGVKIQLLDSDGRVAGHSITDRYGYYYLGEVRPGKYTVMIDRDSLPPGYELEVIAREVEVLSGTEPYDLEDVSFLGEYTGPPVEQAPEPEEIMDEDIRYKVFD